MSVHAMIAAAYLEDLPPSTKLVLMAVADSSDEHTLEAAPGLPKLRAWSGLGKSQALAVVTKLIEARYLERIEAGRIGRRAVYRVFPHGIPAIPHPTEVAARYDQPTGPSTPVDNPEKEGPAGRTLPGQEGPIAPPRGSGPPDPFISNTSVSTRARTDRTPVDSRPAPPAASTGFPGARRRYDPPPTDPRTRPGFHNMPCPNHPAETVPCGRCAHAAANADPVKVAEAKASIRATLRRTPTTEENAS